jgi:uncharacterized membrane protein
MAESMHETSSETASSDVAAEQAPPTPAPLTDRISDALQRLVKALIGSNRRPPRRFRTLLNGTWLGHPLHPAITDVPIGAWLLAVLFDIIWLGSPTANAWAARGAEVAVLVGILGALGAAVTGLADWSDTYGAERTVGLYHAGLNSLALVLYVVSFAARLGISSGASVVAAIFGFAGIISVLVAAFLGGDMVFSKATNVNHTVWPEGTHEYVEVIPVAEIHENTMRRVDAAGVPVVLLLSRGKYAAIAATCSHAARSMRANSRVMWCSAHGTAHAFV